MLPRYYRDKIYTDDEKEYLWIEKLDKGITWVMGQKCKIDSKEYEEALKYYQLRARQLHGDNQQLWKEKQYWRRIENQIYQWGKEWELKREKLNKEEMEAIINSIFQAINIAHGLGGKLAMGKFTGK